MSKVREYSEALVIALVFLAFTNTFVVKTFYIPSSSMEDTLLVGDHLFVNRYIYGPELEALRGVLPSRPVRRGDVVIFRSVEDPDTDVVKRCVARGGDRVEMVAKQLYLNGERVDESAYVVHRAAGEQGARDPSQKAAARRRDNLAPMVVPAGHYFCLGDNRDKSNDSRFWGPLPAAMVKGRALLIYWSNGAETASGSPQGFVERLRHWGRTVVGFFAHTRWGRTFHLVR